MLKAVLADFTAQVDYLTHNELHMRPLSAQPGTRAGEKPSAALSACFDLLPGMTPLKCLAVSRPREARLLPSQHHSMDINLPTKHAPLTQPHINTGSSGSTDTGVPTLVVLTLG